MLNHLINVSSVDIITKGIPEVDCWIDHATWDTIFTMTAAINSAPPQVKAMSFIKTGLWSDSAIKDACKKKGIICVWVNRYTYIRSLDTTYELWGNKEF